MMNSMKYYLGGISASLFLVFSIFTLFPITEVNAEEGISVNPTGYENTIIVEFENNSDSKIKTVRMWPGGEITFESFKSEPGWGGGKYSDGKLIIFTATNTLNPGDSVKFGLVTSEKIDGINWKVLDQNGNDIDSNKAAILSVSETTSDFVKDESEEIEQAKETGNELYGTKKFIPDKIRVGSDLRLVGNGFNSEENLKLYIDDTILKSVNTDKQGNFLTTISIPDTSDAGTSEFIIKDESGNIQTTNINIDEAKNRFLKTTKFEVNTIPNEIKYDEILTISGVAYPQTAVILSFEDMDRILEKSRVVIADSNGEWIFEEEIKRSENLGEKYVIIDNNNDRTTKQLVLKSDYLVEISTSAVRYNIGEDFSIIGTAEPLQQTTIWIKDDDDKIIHYDVFRTGDDGSINYEFPIDDRFDVGTYVLIVKQDEGTDASFFGIGKYPTVGITALLDEKNFKLNTKAVLNIVGPGSSNLSVKILDSNDNIIINDNTKTSSTGKSKHTIDLDGLSSGIYKAVVSSTTTQDSIKFSVGLEAGSGAISLISTQATYTQGESILVLGSTGVDARISITLYDPDGNISSTTETFSDGAGSFSTNQIGIPTDGELGMWKITANSRLDSQSININVSQPTEKGIKLQIDGTEFQTSQTMMIKGVAKSDSSRLEIAIIDQNDQVVINLETPITSDGTFSLPWMVPNSLDSGIYTITVRDAENSDSIEIFIQ